MLLPFGLELKLSKREPKTKPNQLVRRLLSPWGYGKPVDYSFDANAQLRAFRSWVYCAVTLNSQTLAQIPLRLYSAKPTYNTKFYFPTKEVSEQKKDYLLNSCKLWNLKAARTAFDIVEVTDHNFFQLMKNVNSFANNFDLLEMINIHLELVGNAYLYVLKNKLDVPVELWVIPPDRIKPIADPKFFIAGYEYEYGMTKFTFKEEDVIHFKMPNPNSSYVGLSPLQAGLGAYNLNENMTMYNSSLFVNQGRPSGFFTTDDSLDEQDFSRLKEELVTTYAGMNQAGKIGLLDNGLSFEQLNLNPTEMSYIESRKIVKEELLNLFGQTLAMWSENPNRSNSEQAERSYLRRTIRPRCIRIAEKLNEKLLPMFDPSLFIAFDDPSSDDKLIDLKIRTDHIKHGLTTLNEERRKLRLPDLPGGDEPFLQMQMVPLSAIISGDNLKSNQPTDKPKKEDVKAIVDQIKTQLAKD
jgi:HK97 family phage portal protein